MKLRMKRKSHVYTIYKKCSIQHFSYCYTYCDGITITIKHNLWCRLITIKTYNRIIKLAEYKHLPLNELMLEQITENVFRIADNDSLQNFTFTILSDNYTMASVNESYYHEPVPLHQAIITGILLATVIFMTVAGNLLVLLAVFVNSHLRSTTHIFIGNLAVADLLLGKIDE